MRLLYILIFLGLISCADKKIYLITNADCNLSNAKRYHIAEVPEGSRVEFAGDTSMTYFFVPVIFNGKEGFIQDAYLDPEPKPEKKKKKKKKKKSKDELPPFIPLPH